MLHTLKTVVFPWSKIHPVWEMSNKNLKVRTQKSSPAEYFKYFNKKACQKL